MDTLHMHEWDLITLLGDTLQQTKCTDDFLGQLVDFFFGNVSSNNLH